MLVHGLGRICARFDEKKSVAQGKKLSLTTSLQRMQTKNYLCVLWCHIAILSDGMSLISTPSEVIIIGYSLKLNIDPPEHVCN